MKLKTNVNTLERGKIGKSRGKWKNIIGEGKKKMKNTKSVLRGKNLEDKRIIVLAF